MFSFTYIPNNRRCQSTKARLWAVVLFSYFVFVLQIAHIHHASAGPSPYRVGACLSGKVTLDPQINESPEHLYQRTINELKDIASAIQQNVPKGSMEVYPIIPTESQTIPPSPRACTDANIKSGNKYHVWMNLTLDTDKVTQKVIFLCEVNYWDDEGNLQTPLAGPYDRPDAVRELAKTGLEIVAKPVQLPPDPVDPSHAPSRGIIFVYDSSGSMRFTDKDAKNRLGVLATIADMVPHIAQTGAQPMPFAMVVFDNDAEALDNRPGSKWFHMTRSDADIAYTRLKSKLTDKQGAETNIEAAFRMVKRLIDSKKEIEHWNVVFLTDGYPTVGIKDYNQLTRLAIDTLGGKSTLNVVALYGKNPKDHKFTEGANLRQLVGAIKNDTGMPGDVVSLKEGDDLERFRDDIDKIALSITPSTLLDEATLNCIHLPGIEHVKCKLDESKPYSLRLGALPEVKFVADTTAFNVRRCVARIENQGLGSTPLTIVLPEGQSEASQEEPTFKVILSRGLNRMFIKIDMIKGKLNGDWKVEFDMDVAEGRRP